MSALGQKRSSFFKPCPLYPQKRTFRSAVGLSAAQADLHRLSDRRVGSASKNGFVAMAYACEAPNYLISHLVLCGISIAV
jgi:hypothetical protein